VERQQAGRQQRGNQEVDPGRREQTNRRQHVRKVWGCLMLELRRLLKTEVRATKVGDQKRLGGYAAKYGVRSHVIGDQFREVINSGAFDRVLRSNPDTVALINHNTNLALGRTTSVTLRLLSDAVGLALD